MDTRFHQQLTLYKSWKLPIEYCSRFHKNGLDAYQYYARIIAFGVGIAQYTFVYLYMYTYP